jgi:macrolide-specific efflux system membrane fusion protein
MFDHSLSRRILTLLLIAILALPSAAAEPVPAPLEEVQSVVLRLIAEAAVPAQEAGVITAVAVHEGQRVKQGELLAQVDDQVAEMAARSAKLAFDAAREKASSDVEIRYANKAAEVAEAELRRSNESIEHFAKSVSQSQLDVEKLTLEKSRLEAEQAEHQQQIARLEMNSKENEWSAAKVQVARRRIVAPFDGVVVQIYVRLGEWVEPGQKAMRIVNVDRLKAEGFLPAQDVRDNLRDAPARLTVDLPGQAGATFNGKVVFVSPEIDPITGQVRVWAEIDNRDGKLRPGQQVKMTIGAAQGTVVRSP